MKIRISKVNFTILIIAVLAVLSAGTVFYLKVRSGDIDVRITEAEKDKRVPSLNGTLVDAEIAQKRPIAVMIENHPDARPQSGLAQADIVYEALAEGGITRFMAVYHSQEAESIGPVRSARDYYADIANELGALYAHVGGSDEVLQKISNSYYKKLTDLNEFYNGTYFTRIKSRSAPHNTYASTEKLRSYLEDKDLKTKADIRLRPFNDYFGPEGQLADTIAIDFSTPSYKVGYTYNKTNNAYLRNHNGKAHTDAESGKTLEAKNIIIQYVKSAPIPGDEKFRIDVDTKSGGKALVFRGGKVISGAWKVVNGSTQFIDDNGNEIELYRGSTWIELVPISNPNLVTWEDTLTKAE